MANHTCSIDGCEKPMKARGLCAAHYMRARRTGSPTGSKARTHPCAAPGCDRPVKDEYCHMHRRRLARRGTLDLPTAEDLFFRHVTEDAETGCWNFSPATHNRYGQFTVEGRNWPAHRWLYFRMVAELPDSLDLDHLCRNRACVNPEHLDPVTETVNIRRGISPAAENARKTHCKWGHPLSGENLYMTPEGRRQCRICRSRRSVEHLARRSAS